MAAMINASTVSDLDVDDAADEDEADDHHDAAQTQNEQAERADQTALAAAGTLAP